MKGISTKAGQYILGELPLSYDNLKTGACEAMLSLLSQTGDAYIYSTSRLELENIGEFILQKTTDNDLILPLRYDTVLMRPGIHMECRHIG